MPPDLLTTIRGFEGEAPWMYLDTRGYVTVGCGHLLAKPADCFNMGWLEGDEIAKSDWQLVKSSRPGKTLNWYKDIAHSRLPQPAIDRLLLADINIKQRELVKAIPQYTGWPISIQSVLADMAFNMGTAKVLQFNKMLTAMRVADWATAALESTRNGVQPSRNQWAADTIRSASQPV